VLSQVGKFYELYNGDAVLGVQHFGLSMMKGDQAHCGFPELAYGKHAEVRKPSHAFASNFCVR